MISAMPFSVASAVFLQRLYILIQGVCHSLTSRGIAVSAYAIRSRLVIARQIPRSMQLSSRLAESSGKFRPEIQPGSLCCRTAIGSGNKAGATKLAQSKLILIPHRGEGPSRYVAWAPDRPGAARCWTLVHRAPRQRWA